MSNHDFSLKIEAIIRHIKNGTIIERVKWSLEQYKKRRRNRIWKTAVANNSSVVIETSRFAKLRVNTESRLARAIYFNNFEKSERVFVQRYLRSGDRFMDIGANIGIYTVEAASILRSNGHVYAFEPAPQVFALLQENIALNKLQNVEAFQLALSDEDSLQRLNYCGDGFDAWSSFAEPIEGRVAGKVIVESRNWDSLVKQEILPARLDLVKIDVEGWEQKVISGGMNQLRQKHSPTLLVEFTHKAAVAGGGSLDQLKSLLNSLGYSLYQFDMLTGTLVPKLSVQNIVHMNLIATKDINGCMSRLRV